MNAKSIYDKLVNVEVPSSILTYSDKNDCIIIEVQDYDKSVFKFAREFFKGYKSVDIDYTNENKTIVWYNEVSEYSDRETIDSITRFYYDMKVKGLVESKKSARKSIKESSYFDLVKAKEQGYKDYKNRDVGNPYKKGTDLYDAYWFGVEKAENELSGKTHTTFSDEEFDSIFGGKMCKESIKESVEFSKEKDIYIAQIKDSSISFAYTPIDTDDDFNGYFVFDGDDVIEYLNWKGADDNDMLKAFDNFEKAVKKYSSKEDAKIIIKDFHDKLGI